MSRFDFESPDEQTAREFLEWRAKNAMYQVDLYSDTLACVRRLTPVTTEAERREVREYLANRSRA
jgi:hypothetical protein